MKGCHLSPGVRILAVPVANNIVAQLFHCGIGHSPRCVAKETEQLLLFHVCLHCQDLPSQTFTLY